MVVEEETHPIGILSERDVVIAGTDSFHQVETIYQDQFFAAEESTLIRQIAVTIIENNINAVPIIDDEDKVIGIICRTDLLRLLISGSNLEGWA